MNIRNLKIGDIVVAKALFSDRGTEYVVVSNSIDNVLLLWSESKHKCYHIFYDSELDLKFAKFKFDLDI